MATMPRWEWRTWGTAFGAVDQALSQLATASRRIRETYLVSNTSPAAVRIRHATLDARLALDTDAYGLKLWSAPYQAMFPLGADVVARLFGVWNLPLPRLMRETYDIEAFITEIVAAEPDLAPIDIVENRQLIFVESCAVEVSDVWFDGHRLRTLAVSMTERERVAGAVRSLGLSDHKSVDYVQALKRHVEIERSGWTPSRHAARARRIARHMDSGAA